jgi:signal transduction histidine kinase
MHGQGSEETQQSGQINIAMPKMAAERIATGANPNGGQLEPHPANQFTTADLEEDNQVLQGRDRLFEATAKAANVLLTLENFDEAINTALKILVKGTGCDRISVWENGFAASSILPAHATVIYECTRPGIIRQMTHLGSRQISSEGMDPRFLEQYFLNGDGFGGLLEEWDEFIQNVLLVGKVKSSYIVPIRVKGQWWGELCFDYCREAIYISSAEFAVLRTTADCIGSAIKRNRLQQERQQVAQQRTTDLEAYNQVLQGRDRLLEVTARASNVLLTLDNIEVAIKTALTVLIEGTGCDRIKILENVYESSSPMPIRYLNTIQKCLDPQFEITRNDIEPAQAAELSDAFKKYFLEMNGFGGFLEEWDEPLRSWLATLQIQSTYAVPIRVNGQWWGVLCFDYCRAPIQFNPAEVAVLRTIADCIGSAIQRDRTQQALLEAEQNRSAELAKANTAMRRSIDWLAREPDMNAFLGHLMEELVTQVDAQDALIFLYDAQERTLQTSVGVINDEVTFCAPFTQKFSVDEWQGWEVLLRSPNPRLFDLDTEPHLFLPEYLEFHRRRNNRGIVCTLLQQDDEPLGFIGFCCIRETFSENELELVQSLAQQATLAIQMTRLAEEAKQTALLQERARMAREIHDTLAQAFGGISMQLQAFNYFAATQPDQAQTHLLTAQALAKEGLAEARRSVWTLYLETAEYENLDQAIAKFIQQTTPRQATPIHLAIEGTPDSLHPDLGLNLLRIAQEAITNALRHAHATTIQVHLSYSAQALQLTIRDDGCGFDPQSSTHGFGLLGMQQRASRIGATWNLMSRPGEGTTLMITLPNSQNTSISKA